MLSRIKRFFRSLRFGIFAAVFLAVLVPTVAVSVISLAVYEKRSISTDISSLTGQAKLLNNQIVSTGFMADPSLSFLNAELTALGNAYGGRIMVIDSSLRVIKDTYSVDEGRTIVWENVLRASKGETVSYVDDVNGCIIVTAPIAPLSTVDGDDGKALQNVQNSTGSAADIAQGSPYSGTGVLLLIKSTEYMTQNLAFMKNLVRETILIALIVATALALFISDRMTRGPKRIRRLITRVQDGQIQSIPVTGFTEDRDIASAFNDYNEKMLAIDSSRTEFVSNVSHELKTPLASIKVLADSINSMGENAPIDVYRDFMGDITHEIDRETKIINDLLSLVKLDKSGVSLTIAKVNINEMLEQLLKRLRPLAEQAEVELVLESFRPVTAEIDEVKFSLAIMNLVENGIKYNHKGGWVHVSLNSDHEYFFIRVEDCGMGIPEESLDHIFERFYRVDKSHSREIGGTGLGLAITWNAIALHRGEIKVSSKLGEGTVFDVRVPLRFIEKEEL